MRIKIENVKGIRSLDFEIPSGGVWILTGLNGTGKSTMLATLYRIRNSYAFQKFFRTSPLADRVDLYDDASINYEINGQSVTYRYGGQRWRASPRANSTILGNFPYSTVSYIEANSERIEPFADEIAPNRLRDASDDIKEFLVTVLADNKWNNLKFVNTRRGRGNEAFLIPYRPGRGYAYKYYSEKSFSLGELCILRLAKRISEIQNDGLVLIDEIEMALHPQAQVRLLEKLRSVSHDKNTTVIFSTHSASIVKSAGRRNLIHLVNMGENRIEVIRNPYPAQILGDIAFDDELGADFVFFVEDKQAKLLLEQMIQEYLAIANPDINYQPLCKIAPVGGFVQVLEFVNGSSQIFPNYVRRYAFLDEDVKTESLQSAQHRNDHRLLDLFNRSEEILNYLPCTPEVGLVDMIEGQHMRQEIRNSFPGHAINIGRIIQTADYQALQSQNPRDLAKKKISYMVENMNQITGIDEIQIRRTLYKIYTKYKYGDAIGNLRALLGPIFNVRGT
ncbi:AAA family ATPase [Picosynechococcus sp. PCC 73109]|uniref:AAA family ATPase n=1 Tax=Picosynechococcus sp. PCC 73109 TaxID=374982 RepID=UPI0007458B66|nr:AAA family ATPase [Picosynechococcus sp. PCC 73109]AMA09443.1 ATP-binding protein [Picosynechococcus sp. PCC 73109]